MNFLDLNMDCQFMILEKMDFFTLFSMAETSTQFSSLVSEVVRRTFIKKQLIIASPYTDWFLDGPRLIGIQHFETAVKVLENFGQFIKNLAIENEFVDDERNAQIFELVRSNCWKSLIEVHLTNPESNFFSKSKNAFSNVEFVDITGNFDNVHNLDETFPKMRRLKLNIRKISNISDIDSKHEFLEDLTVKLLSRKSNDGTFSEAVAERLIKNNRQIRRLRLEHSSSNLLRIAADSLQNLDCLELDEYDESSTLNDQTLHFETVRRFKIGDSSVSMPSRISFGSLEELEIGVVPHKCTRWLGLIESHSNLRILRINFPVDNHIVSRLRRARLSLYQISLKFYTDFDIENMIKLIQSCKELNNAHFDMTWTATQVQWAADILREKIEKHWIIKNDSYDIYLERRRGEETY